MTVEEYEAALWRQKARGIPLRPVPPPPNIGREWTAREEDEWRRHRAQLEQAYNRVKNAKRLQDV